MLQQAFSGLTGELAGTYYSLGGLTEEQTSFLLGKGFLFQVGRANGRGNACMWDICLGIPITAMSSLVRVCVCVVDCLPPTS